MKIPRFTFLTIASLASLPLAFAVEKELAGTSVPQVFAQGARDLQPRPIPMGVSIGNSPSSPFIYAGTAGLLVRSIANPNNKFILSNNHVLGTKGPGLCPNQATPGGTITLQPGTLDIGTDPGASPTYVAGLVAGFQPLVTTAPNLIDAALSITTPALARTTQLDIGEPNPTVGIALPGMSVIKSGRTTGVTSGTVDAINVTINVNYGSGCPTYLFIGQTIITPGTFSAGGDSGSAILEASTRTPVGLLFAGSTGFTAANQILWAYLQFGVLPEVPFGGPSSVNSVAELQQAREAAESKMDARLRAAIAVQNAHQQRLFKMEGVTAVGVGKADGEYVIKVYGARAQASALRSALTTRLDGVRVVFAESEHFSAR